MKRDNRNRTECDNCHNGHAMKCPCCWLVLCKECWDIHHNSGRMGFLTVTSNHDWTDDEVRKLEKLLGCDALVHDTSPRQLVFPKSPWVESLSHSFDDISEMVFLNFSDSVKVGMIMP